jgi:hypothetical protein
LPDEEEAALAEV